MHRRFREPVNGLSHLAAAVMALAGLVWLVIERTHAPGLGSVWPVALFGCTMLLLFVSSTLYHSLHVSPQAIAHLRRVDHMMIYVFIAGTYTPICVLALGGKLGWGLFIAVWVIAMAGVILKIAWMEAPRWLYLLTYLGMGWIGALFVPQVASAMSGGALAWLVAGGLFYTIGAGIYASQRPVLIPGWLGFHELWHLCVIGGAFSHFWVIRSVAGA